VVGVEQWAEIRRLYFVKRLSIKEVVRRIVDGGNTIRRGLRSAGAPRYRRPPRPSMLDRFRDEVDRLLRRDPRLPGERVRELHLVSAGGALPVRPLGAEPGDPRRRRPDRARLRRRRLPALLACRLRDAGVLEGGARSAVRDRSLPRPAGRAAGDAGLGPRGRAARRRRPPGRAVGGVLRSARRRLAVPRGEGSAIEGCGRAAAGLRGDELRARSELRQRARLPAAARPLVR
jgi:hypothetical protein